MHLGRIGSALASTRRNRTFGAAAVLIAVVAAGTAALGTPGREAAVTEQRLDQLAERTLRDLLAETRAPGGALVLRRGQHIERLALGVADRRMRAPMTMKARHRIASVTKTFVATVVLQLVSEGRLSLDDRVGALLPPPLVDGGRVTLRSLLNHTSGIYAGGPLDPRPGRFVYDNKNFVLLGDLIERTTGVAVAEAIQERVLDPLGLRGTTWPTQAVPSGIARGYTPSGTDVTPVAPGALDAAWALVSTPDDLVAFVDALLTGRLVPDRELAAMKTSVAVPDTDRPHDELYGLGLMGFETPCGTVWGHRGRTDGSTVLVFASPDGRRSAAAALNVGRIPDEEVVQVNRALFASLCE